MFPQDDPNKKHGGAFPVPNGPILIIEPGTGDVDLQCNDIAKATRWLSREPLESAIIEFCNSRGSVSPDGTKAGDYAEETINAVHLSITNYKPTITTEECHSHFIRICDGCDVPSGPPKNSNPLNFKAGGKAIIGATQYLILPQAERKPPDPIASGDDYVKDAKIVSKGNTGTDGKAIDMGIMQDCLRSLKDKGWYGDTVCGNLYWTAFGLSWNDPGDCYRACVNALSRAINAGANSAECRFNYASAICDMRFSTQSRDELR